MAWLSLHLQELLVLYYQTETFAFILYNDASLIMKHEWHVIIALVKFHVTYLSPKYRVDLHVYFQYINYTCSQHLSEFSFLKICMMF